MEKVGRQTLLGLAVLFIANKGDFPLSFLKQQLTLWLNRTRREKDESNLTVSERIVKMFEFQIPYYIGPISPIVNGDMKYSKNVWSVRKEAGKVYPWNFEQKIDTEESEIYLQNGKALYLHRRGRSSSEKFTFVREAYGTK